MLHNWIPGAFLSTTWCSAVASVEESSPLRKGYEELHYKQNDDSEALVGYADADWPSDAEDRKSEELWLHGILEDLKQVRRGTVSTLFEDNRGCTTMATSM